MTTQTLNFSKIKEIALNNYYWGWIWVFAYIAHLSFAIYHITTFLLNPSHETDIFQGFMVFSTFVILINTMSFFVICYAITKKAHFGFMVLGLILMSYVSYTEFYDEVVHTWFVKWDLYPQILYHHSDINSVYVNVYFYFFALFLGLARYAYEKYKKNKLVIHERLLIALFISNTPFFLLFHTVAGLPMFYEHIGVTSRLMTNIAYVYEQGSPLYKDLCKANNMKCEAVEIDFDKDTGDLKIFGQNSTHFYTRNFVDFFRNEHLYNPDTKLPKHHFNTFNEGDGAKCLFGLSLIEKSDARPELFLQSDCYYVKRSFINGEVFVSILFLTSQTVWIWGAILLSLFHYKRFKKLRPQERNNYNDNLK